MNDPTLVQLARVIQQGWPESAKELADDIKVYFPYRFELHIVNGIVFLEKRIVVPIGLHHMFLTELHESHLGIIKTRLLAHTLIYWPNWNDDITRVCNECECHENQNMPTNVPNFK